jgi:hypothetical protein
MTTRTISAVAREIRAEWPKVYFGAEPYLAAMSRLQGPDDMYMYDDARSVVRYFLANARGFKGERAKALKAELKTIIGD